MLSRTNKVQKKCIIIPGLDRMGEGGGPHAVPEVNAWEGPGQPEPEISTLFSK